MSTETIEGNTELRSELLHALFALRNMHFHRLGQQIIGAGGLTRRRHMSICGEPGLNVQEFALLKQLKMREEKGEVSGGWLTEMGDYLRVSKAAISQTIGALERRGIITREPDPNNRRTIIVRLTEKGNTMIESFTREFDSYLAMIIDRFGENDTREIIRLIYKFTDIIEIILETTDEARE